MHNLGIEQILVNVEKPSRYLGTEINRVVKDPADTELHMALAFPDLYEIGTSHFGIQILYHLLNQRPNIYVERVFAPANDMADLMRQKAVPLSSLETRTPLAHFHILGFSLLYELNFTNVLNMLDLAAIPIYADQRNASHPMVIAGGPCVSNPEPMAAFFDAMVFGDGEQVLPQMADVWLAWNTAQSHDRLDLLQRWAKLEGVYIPSFFNVHYDTAGCQQLQPQSSTPARISRAIVADLDSAFFPEKPTIPFAKPVHDRLRLEISRGCSRGCRFCQAGMIYRPVRERSPQRLLDITQNSLVATGYEDLSLLSLSTGDYTCLAPLMETLMQRCQADKVAVSLPSVRAGTLTPGLMTHIKKVRKTGFTIAPEAGSQRLRDVINKNVTFDDIAHTVRDAFDLGWKVIKLYFMIGLPTETWEDIDAIVRMVQALKQMKGPTQRRGNIHVSVTTFIPKAHTPFQWACQIDLDESWAKINYLKERLRQPGVQVKWQNPNMSLLEGVIARGDRRVAGAIERAWQLGCTFDGWTDHFNFARWRQAFDDVNLSMDFFTTRPRSLDESLPWDHMDAKISRAFLQSELAAAKQGQRLTDCRFDRCHQCGACDFKAVAPQLFDRCPNPGQQQTFSDAQPSPENFVLLEVFYTKLGQARFFGHLEMAGIIARALRRAGIQVLFSQGFHPMPRISFDDPIPLGMESHAERLRIKVAPQYGCTELMTALNAHLPSGVTLIHCRQLRSQKDKMQICAHSYHLYLDPDWIDTQALDRFHSSPQWPYQRTSHKGRAHHIDLKGCVTHFEPIEGNRLFLQVRTDPPPIARPSDLLRSVLGIKEADLEKIRVVKLAPDGLPK